MGIARQVSLGRERCDRGDQLRQERGMLDMTRSTWARMSSKTASAERRASTIWKS